MTRAWRVVHAPRLAVSLAFVLALAPSAFARTWTVGGPGADYPLLGPAVAGASSGDTIRVRRGAYREDLVIDKTLAIVGEGDPVLFGTGAGTIVTIAAPGCELRGLTLDGSGTGDTNEMDAAVHVLSNGNRIVENRMRRVFYGIVVANATHNEIADNTIDGLADLPFGRRGDGIYLYRAPENFVARNRIAGMRDAIYFQYAPDGRAIENVVSNSRYGLHDMFSDGARIAGNTFSGSTAGANVMNSRRIAIERNRFVANRTVSGVGLSLKDCDDSRVVGNEFAANPRGLLVDGSSSNRFLDNTFRANDTAVTLFSSAERNTFAGNRFLENWSDVVLSGGESSTAWSLAGRGNYWSRYRGFDFDGDGVGDAPHPILGAFERIEGENAAARIFLQSPAATGLELAARLSGRVDAGAIDDRPLADAGIDLSRAPAGARHPLAAGLVFAIVALAAFVLIREVRPCSRSLA